jgi:hypothetical protein
LAERREVFEMRLADLSTDAPNPDVIEISIFGPGKGESIALHLGDGHWIVVDSCRDQTTGVVPVLDYFDRIGVDVARQVDMVVGTHAHDDHFAGISEIFQASESAFFVSSLALTRDEFYVLTEVDAFLESTFRQSAYKEYRRIHELVAERGAKLPRAVQRRAHEGRVLLRLDLLCGLPSEVTALSPSDESVTRALSKLASEAAIAGGVRRIPACDPNELAVALWIEAAGKKILLGADLLNGPARCGWQAVLSSEVVTGQASVVKVPHHGSPNAHHDQTWSDMVTEKPMALLAPYRAGRTPRPAPQDIQRLCKITGDVYITASPALPASSKAVRKAAASLGQLAQRVREPWGRCGQVRVRARIGHEEWHVELVPPARLLCAGRRS